MAACSRGEWAIEWVDGWGKMMFSLWRGEGVVDTECVCVCCWRCLRRLIPAPSAPQPRASPPGSSRLAAHRSDGSRRLSHSVLRSILRAIFCSMGVAESRAEVVACPEASPLEARRKRKLYTEQSKSTATISYKYLKHGSDEEKIVSNFRVFISNYPFNGRIFILIAK